MEIYLNGLNLSPAVLAGAQIALLVVMLVGLFSLLLVIIPGLTIIWLAALIFGILVGFDLAGTIIFLILTAMMVVGNVLDQILMGARAKKSGASWLGIFLATLAAFVFSILMPPFGGMIAALVTLMAVELVRLKDWRKAARTSREMAAGCATAVVARFAMGLVMIGVWLLWVSRSGHWF